MMKVMNTLILFVLTPIFFAKLVTPLDSSEDLPSCDEENVLPICYNYEVMRTEYYSKGDEDTFNLQRTICRCNCTIGSVILLNPIPDYYNHSERYLGEYEKNFACINVDGNKATNVDGNKATNVDGKKATNVDGNKATNVDGNKATNVDENNATNVDENNATNVDENNATNVDENNATNVDENNATNVDENIYVTYDDDDEDDDELKKRNCLENEVFKVEYLIDGEKRHTGLYSCKCDGDFERNVRTEKGNNGLESLVYECGRRIKPLKKPYCEAEDVCKTHVYNTLDFEHSEKYLDKYNEHCSCSQRHRNRPNQRCVRTGDGELLKYYTCTSPGCKLNQRSITLKYQSLDKFLHAAEKIEYCKCGNSERIDARPINVTNIDYFEMHFRCLQSDT